MTLLTATTTAHSFQFDADIDSEDHMIDLFSVEDAVETYWDELDEYSDY